MRFSSNNFRSGNNESWMGSWHNALLLPAAIISMAVADHFESSTAWAGSMVAIMATSLFAWHAKAHGQKLKLRYRSITGMPYIYCASRAMGAPTCSRIIRTHTRTALF